MSTSESTPLPKHLEDLTGQKFGRWTILSFAGMVPRSGRRQDARWKCQCECGEPRDVVHNSLVKGLSHSCGCLQKELIATRKTTHGMSQRPEFNIWENMIDRCERPNNSFYHLYGGRGIQVCQEWRASFEAFFAHIGPRPTPKHTIDRYPDNDGNYAPSNVRWATKSEQARNRRNNRLYTYHGETLTVAEWALRFQMNYSTLYQRVDRSGWTIERALETPVRQFATKEKRGFS